jgi:hypothetical protein
VGIRKEHGQTNNVEVVVACLVEAWRMQVWRVQEKVVGWNPLFHGWMTPYKHEMN